VLAEAVERRGTSFSDYFDLDGRRGTFQDVLSVFDRAGSPCLKCGSGIRRIIQTGRASFYCPRCQC
jgi:formamidopyrimidine-DNA glycosylase